MNATRHNHDALPFGRRLSLGCCPRCDELHVGAAPRKGWRQKPVAAPVRLIPSILSTMILAAGE